MKKRFSPRRPGLAPWITLGLRRGSIHHVVVVRLHPPRPIYEPPVPESHLDGLVARPFVSHPTTGSGFSGWPDRFGRRGGESHRDRRHGQPKADFVRV